MIFRGTKVLPQSASDGQGFFNKYRPALDAIGQPLTWNQLHPQKVTTGRSPAGTLVYIRPYCDGNFSRRISPVRPACGSLAYLGQPAYNSYPLENLPSPS